jgi:nucleoid-associated protein
MELLQAVIHEFIKEPAKEGRPAIEAHYTEATEQLDVSEEPTVKLVESIRSLYGSKGNYSSQGTFDLADSAQTFPDNFATFVDSSGDDDAFLELTIQTMDNLVARSAPQNFATGGYIVFAHYTYGGQNYFLVAMVKKKDGITLVNLKPETIQEVDLSKLHQAIRINNTSYLQAMELIEEGEPFDGSYLSFISPVSNQGASGYFIQAFGCHDAIPAKKATISAFDAVRYYFDSNVQIRHLKSEAVDSLVELFNNLLNNEDEENRICTLEILNERVSSIITYHEIENAPNDFMEIANSEDFNVPDSFYPSKQALTEQTRVKLKGMDGAWALNFEKRVFGSSDDSDIQFNPQTSSNQASIVIRNLSADLINVLERALEDEPDS